MPNRGMFEHIKVDQKGALLIKNGISRPKELSLFKRLSVKRSLSDLFARESLAIHCQVCQVLANRPRSSQERRSPLIVATKEPLSVRTMIRLLSCGSYHTSRLPWISSGSLQPERTQVSSAGQSQPVHSPAHK